MQETRSTPILSHSPSSPNDLLAQAIALHRAGNLGEAETIYTNLLTADPVNADMLTLLGTLQIQRDNLGEGLRLLNEAIAINPTHSEAHNNRASILNRLRQYEEALAGFDKAGILDPSYAEAYYNWGNILNQLKRHDEALASYDKAIALNPNHAEAYNNRGNALNHLKRYEEAVVSYNKATQINPNYDQIYINRGVVLFELTRYDEALASYDKAMAMNPDRAEIYNNRGLVLFRQKRYDEALASYDKAIAMKSDYAEAYYNRGYCMQELKHYSEALVDYDTVIALNSDNAEAYYGKGIIKLALGEYKEGWKLCEWRWKIKSMATEIRSFPEPLWLGKESLSGKTILLHAEQGFGDTLQFCRYVPMVEALGARVILEAPPALTGLLSTLKGSHQIQLLAKNNPLPDFDFHCPLMSLPLVFGTTVETIPSEPYLRAQPEYINKWRPILDEKMGAPSKTLRIGLCWAGGQRPNKRGYVIIDAKRSVHFNQFKPLLDVQKASFVSLQLGLPKDQLDDERVIDISSQLKNWSDTAAVVSLLDLVISVDTSVCHLAGAMGKKTWMLNRYDTCWRWLLDRDDSPWYPTLKQFRQETAGDWDSVVARVKAELEAIHL